MSDHGAQRSGNSRVPQPRGLPLLRLASNDAATARVVMPTMLREGLLRLKRSHSVLDEMALFCGTEGEIVHE